MDWPLLSDGVFLSRELVHANPVAHHLLVLHEGVARMEVFGPHNGNRVRISNVEGLRYSVIGAVHVNMSAIKSLTL